MSLDKRFEKFILSLPSIEGIDQLALVDNEKKADYLGMGRKIIFEQKSITQDQASRIDKEIEKYAQDENYPLFFGKRDINLIIDKLPNKDEIKRNIYSNITKLLESYLSQANKQIESTRNIFNIKDATGILIILNENIKVLSPEIISMRIQQRLREVRNDKPRFHNIDHVILVTETHTFQDRSVVVCIEGSGATKNSPNIAEYIRYLVSSWSQFNGGGYLIIDENSSFFEAMEEKKEPAPEKVSRSEARAIWYREYRYMKKWTDEQVTKGAAKCIDLIQPYLMKEGPNLPTNELAEMMMGFGDFIEESNIRGLDLRELKKFHH